MAHPVLRLGETQLNDGRALAWAEWGPEDGRPVVLCPGAGTSRSLGFGQDVLDKLGLRVVSIDRPGLGHSDPKPGRTLADWPRDVEQLGLEAPAVVGYSQGAPFALACATAGLVSACAVVSGTDELSHPAFSATLDPELRALVELASTDPRAAEETFAQMTAETLYAMVLDYAGADRALYEQPAFRVAIEEAFRQGAGGYARDTVLAMAPWPLDLGEITVPVDLWYGTRDPSPVHSPDSGGTLTKRIPTARRHLDHDAGGALLWTHAEAILRWLLTPG
jgi:pimeloyl-ACP methyl ester carboxylesterase